MHKNGSYPAASARIYISTFSCHQGYPVAFQGVWLLLTGLFCLFFLYAVPESVQAASVDVSVTGVASRVRENVLKMLEIYRERDKAGLAPGRIQFLHKRAADDIKKALEPFGYFKCRVKGSLKAPQKKGGPWRAFYDIEKGPRIRIGSVKFEITGEGKGERIFSQPPPFKKGAILDQEKYGRFKEELLETAMRHGFLDAKFSEHRIVIDLKKYTALINLQFDTGPRYLFGSIHFSGTDLSPDFLKRFFYLRHNQVFDQNELLKTKARLLDSRYFKAVDIRPLRKKSTDKTHIPVEVIVSMNRPNVYKAGLGYASDTGPRVILEWKRRYIGKSGHRMDARILYSAKDSSLEGNYIIPLQRPDSEYLSFNPGIERYDTRNRDGWHYTGTLTHSTINDSGWRRNIGFDLGYETYHVGDDSSSSGEFLPGISWYKTVSDNIIYTTMGHMIKVGCTAAIKGLLADESYLRPKFSTKWIRAFDERFRLISRMDLGAVLARDLRKLPGSTRFFTGGLTSIRGFSLDELGPEDPKNGDIMGGRYLAVGSVEVERQIFGNWMGAVFCDAGNSFDPDLVNKVEVGTGFGIRWRTPLGMVKLDFGFGVSKHPVPFKFYFSMGPDF